MFERLAALWQEGLSMSEIAKKLCTTKAAVSSAIYRSGLPKRGNPIKLNRLLWNAELLEFVKTQAQAGYSSFEIAGQIDNPRIAPENVRRVMYRLGFGQPRHATIAQRAPWTRPPPVRVDVSTLMTSPRACQWPLWGREAATHQYCGAPARSGRPYCADHHRIAFVAVGAVDDVEEQHHDA